MRVGTVCKLRRVFYISGYKGLEGWIPAGHTLRHAVHAPRLQTVHQNQKVSGGGGEGVCVCVSVNSSLATTLVGDSLFGPQRRLLVVCKLHGVVHQRH